MTTFFWDAFDARQRPAAEDGFWIQLPHPEGIPPTTPEGLLAGAHACLKPLVAVPPGTPIPAAEMLALLAAQGLTLPHAWVPAVEASPVLMPPAGWLAPAIAAAGVSPVYPLQSGDRLELWRTARGEKSATRWLVPGTMLPMVRLLLDWVGLAYLISPWPLMLTGTPFPAQPLESASVAIWFSRTPAWAQLAYLCDLLQLPEALGIVLGYPPCCVQIWSEPSAVPPPLLTTLHTTTPPPYPLWTNSLIRGVWGGAAISHFPCRYTCDASVSLGQQALASFAQGDPPTAAAIQQGLRIPMVVHRDQTVCLLMRTVRHPRGVMEYDPATLRASARDTEAMRILQRHTRIEWEGPFQSRLSGGAMAAEQVDMLALLLFE